MSFPKKMWVDIPKAEIFRKTDQAQKKEETVLVRKMNLILRFQTDLEICFLRSYESSELIKQRRAEFLCLQTLKEVVGWGVCL